MSIQNTVTKCQYVGNGNTTVFPYTFTLSPKHPEYVVVYITGADGNTATTNNVTIDTAAQSVTYPADGSAPLAVGEKITIARFVPYKQILNLVNQGPFFAEDIETELDEIVSMIQQLAEANDRCLKSNISEDTEVDWTLPVAQPGHIFCWSEDGKSLVNVDIEAIVQRAETAVTEAAEQVDLAAAQTEKAKAQADEAKAQAEAAAASAAEAADVVDPEAVDRKISAHNASLDAHADKFSSPIAKWVSGTTYKVDDIRIYDNKIWMCITPNNDAAFDKAKWLNIGGGGGGPYLGEFLLLTAEEAGGYEGILKADGAELSRTMYPDLNRLYAAQGYPWGAGDGSTTFNLPNLIGRFAEGAEQAGGYHEAGLPNIEGTFQPGVHESECGFSSYSKASGAISSVSVGTTGYICTNSQGLYDQHQIKFSAQKSNPIYGNSTTVQPPSALLLPYVVVFTDATPDSALVDMTQVGQDLAGKANRSLSNVDANVDFVVDSYSGEDGNWYRVYKSGWVEQGGTTAYNAAAAARLNISFLKPFINDKYALSFSCGLDNDTFPTNKSSTSVVPQSYFSRLKSHSGKTATGFVLSEGTYSTSWMAVGQGAEV